MSLTVAAAVAAEIGVTGIDGMLKYEKRQYQRKIEEFESYNNELKQHLERLESLKAQIPNFWTDAKGEKASRTIDATIQKVKGASNRIESLRVIYEETVEEFQKKDDKLVTVLDEAEDLIKNLLD